MRTRRVGALAVLFGAAFTAGCSDDDPRSHQQMALGAAVRVEAEGCGMHPVVGGGSFVAPHRVLTVAHVVAGASDIDVVLSDRSEHEAVVVAVDREKDLAVLDVNADIAPLPHGSMRVGAKGEFVTWRTGLPATSAFTSLAFVDIQANDIDDIDLVPRRGYEVRADVEPGDSGSVLVADGRAVAVMFARSTKHPDRGWATDIAEADPLLQSANDQPVDVGNCPTTDDD
jgi:S1-C subfamily serine protease